MEDYRRKLVCWEDEMVRQGKEWLLKPTSQIDQPVEEKKKVNRKKWISKEELVSSHWHHYNWILRSISFQSITYLGKISSYKDPHVFTIWMKFLKMMSTINSFLKIENSYFENLRRKYWNMLLISWPRNWFWSWSVTILKSQHNFLRCHVHRFKIKI